MLLFVTFLFQERRVLNEQAYKLKQETLINFEIKHLKLPHAHAEKKDGKWWENGTLLSHNNFKIIERKLSEIRKIKEVKGEWSAYFSSPLEFEINHQQWFIGDISLNGQEFYFGTKDKVYLSYIEGESLQMTGQEEEIAKIKHNELIGALSKTREELIETQLFRFYPKLPLKKVIIEADGALAFELNFDEKTTLPPPIEGVETHLNLLEKFNSLLTQATLKKELPFSENLKFKKLGQIIFSDNKATVRWELWLKNKNSADVLIIDPDQHKAYLMIGGTLKLFFVRIQDYWDKKVIPQKAFERFSKIKATFSKDNNKCEIFIFNQEPLDFRSETCEIDKLKMDELFQYLFNLGPRDQADRVSQLTSSEKKQLVSDSNLQVNLMNQNLVVVRKKEELIVANFTQGFKAHFVISDENFFTDYEAMIKWQ